MKNSKLQAPNSKENPNYKLQIPKLVFLDFGIWGLVLFVFWNLEFAFLEFAFYKYLCSFLLKYNFYL
ncbi:MAG: hypothetical protein CL528_01205 [Aequorivita sp.]|nr:hypothetical protein [Aequorivita sp.]MBP40367.1 hypothetical protein [Aequorivita sp.]